MKTIAVITGASSGMGRRFVETIGSLGRPVDEIWAIARREDRLRELKAPCPVRPVPLDLSDRGSFREYRALLEREKPSVALLVCASGYGKFGAVCDCAPEENLNMLDVNCGGVMALCQLTIPYMRSGSHILNIASVAAFQPIPYIGVYGATKAFVLSFSRALNRELRPRGISVTALCPFWTKTEFFDRAVAKNEKPVVRHYAVMYDPEDIVRRAWRDLLRGRDVSEYGFVARAQGALVRLLPHSLVMDIWMRDQGL